MIATAAAELAATRKEAEYVELSTSHHFVPLAFELLCLIGTKAMIFFKRTRSSLSTRNGKPNRTCISTPAPVCSIPALLYCVRSGLLRWQTGQR